MRPWSKSSNSKSNRKKPRSKAQFNYTHSPDGRCIAYLELKLFKTLCPSRANRVSQSVALSQLISEAIHHS